ncbi:MAG: hypothetical protein CMM49_03615 [Rhodospirillaceae bacterium]|nr:hypothetical protein [Rhodospirillaceae bacterium]|tara:strand:- start:1600 stop:2319 length:720 start_codon:yes stop_codon:yes gene_type:complete
MELNLLIIRPRQDADLLSNDLNKIGIKTTIFPIFKFINLNPVLPDIKEFKYILTSSRNGIRTFAKNFTERELTLYVVGEGSAQEAKNQGFKNIIVGNNSMSELCKNINSTLNKNSGKLLYVSGVYQNYDVTRYLRFNGYRIENLVLYDLNPISYLSEGVLKKLEDGIINGVLFFSPRSAIIFSDLLKKARKDNIAEQLRAFCLSKKIAEKVNKLNWKMTYVSATSNKASLIDLLSYLCK